MCFICPLQRPSMLNDGLLLSSKWEKVKKAQYCIPETSENAKKSLKKVAESKS